MRVLLDTNACIEAIRPKGNVAVRRRLAAEGEGDVAVCSIVRAELILGVHKSRNPAESLQRVEKFLRVFPSLPFDDAAADRAGELIAVLEQRGLRIGMNDMLIAAIALAHGLTVVTHNIGEFSRIPGLRIEDWEGLG